MGIYIDKNQKENGKKKFATVAFDFIVEVFQPLIPAIAGAGILKATLILLSMSGIISTQDFLYRVFFNAADAAMYYMPLAVAVTSAMKLKCNMLVALAVAGSLVLPNMVTMILGDCEIRIFYQRVEKPAFMRIFLTKHKKGIRVLFTIKLKVEENQIFRFENTRIEPNKFEFHNRL